MTDFSARFYDLREWEESDKVGCCFKCQKEFSVLIWKHHCRGCGRIMCKKCTNYFTRIPVTELCPGCPGYVDPKYPQRCCLACATRIRGRLGQPEVDVPPPQSQQLSHLSAHSAKPIVGVRITESLDFDPNFHSKVYKVQIPANRTVSPGQVVRVELGTRVNRVLIPDGIHAGDVMYVRGNDVLVRRNPSEDHHHHHGEGAVSGQAVVVEATAVADQVTSRLYQISEHPERQAAYNRSYSHSHSRSASEDEYSSSSGRSRSSGGSRSSGDSSGSGSGDHHDPRRPRHHHSHHLHPEEPLHLIGEVDDEYAEFVTCPACTYHNRQDRRHCEMCLVRLH